MAEDGDASPVRDAWRKGWNSSSKNNNAPPKGEALRTKT
jgi:hypothetical protein